MPSEGFFMAIGGLGLSLAGFTGLLAAFHTEESTDAAVYQWRIRVIVTASLFVLFLGFGVVPIHDWTGDTELTVRIATALVVLLAVVLQVRFGGPGPAWPDESRRRIVRSAVAVQIAIVAINLFVASVAFLQVIFLWLLFTPASAFYNAVRDEATKTVSSPKG